MFTTPCKDESQNENIVQNITKDYVTCASHRQNVSAAKATPSFMIFAVTILINRMNFQHHMKVQPLYFLTPTAIAVDFLST